MRKIVRQKYICNMQIHDTFKFFCETEEEQILMLRIIYIIFEAVYGLHINWRKNFIYFINEVTLGLSDREIRW